MKASVIFQAQLPPCEHIDCFVPCQCSDEGCWLQEDPVTGQPCHACGACIPDIPDVSELLLPRCPHIYCLDVFCDSDEYNIHTIPGTNQKCRGCQICNIAPASWMTHKLARCSMKPSVVSPLKAVWKHNISIRCLLNVARTFRRTFTLLYDITDQ